MQWYKYNFIKLFGIRMKEVSKVEVNIDKEQSLKLLEQAGTLILQALNKNINEPGLIETPKRFAKIICVDLFRLIIVL